MGWTIACLCLCLLATVHATDKIVLVNSWGQKVLTGADDGAATSVPDMSWATNTVFPTSDWYAQAWVQVLAGTPDTARFLQFAASDGTNVVDFYVTWTSTASPKFTFGGTGHTVMGGTPGFRNEGTWFHIVMGSSPGSSFGYITFRKTANYQFSVTWVETIWLSRASTLVAPANASPFTVRYT